MKYIFYNEDIINNKPKLFYDEDTRQKNDYKLFRVSFLMLFCEQ